MGDTHSRDAQLTGVIGGWVDALYCTALHCTALTKDLSLGTEASLAPEAAPNTTTRQRARLAMPGHPVVNALCQHFLCVHMCILVCCLFDDLHLLSDQLGSCRLCACMSLNLHFARVPQHL